MINIQDNLLKDIEKYCNINNINNIEEEINKILRIGFNVIKFGNSPFERRDMEKGLTAKITDLKEEKVENVMPIEILQEESKKEEKTVVEEPKPKRKYSRKVRIIKNE